MVDTLVLVVDTPVFVIPQPIWAGDTAIVPVSQMMLSSGFVCTFIYEDTVVEDPLISPRDRYNTAVIPTAPNPNAFILKRKKSEFERIYFNPNHYTDILHDTTVINNYIHDTTFLPIDYYTLTVVAEQPTMGIVVGSGTYTDSTVVEIAAIPIAGYHFTGWSDGVTDNPRHILVTEDITITASFAQDQVGMTTIEPDGISITTDGLYIDVEGAYGQSIHIYDMLGRRLVTKHSQSNTNIFRVTTVGVYLVQVGDAPARRVVIR
jgi:hypothetical protein